MSSVSVSVSLSQSVSVFQCTSRELSSVSRCVVVFSVCLGVSLSVCFGVSQFLSRMSLNICLGLSVSVSVSLNVFRCLNVLLVSCLTVSVSSVSVSVPLSVSLCVSEFLSRCLQCLSRCLQCPSRCLYVSLSSPMSLSISVPACSTVCPLAAGCWL